MHTTCLLGGIAKVLEKIDQIPSDKCVRLLFQPAEEIGGGALIMIQEGALEGVNKVYGFHNLPVAQPGEMLVQPGHMLGLATILFLTIKGKGGHTKDVEELNDPLQPAIDIQLGFRNLVNEYRDKGTKFLVRIPYIRSSTSYSIIADTCRLEGYLIAFDEDFTQEFKLRFTELATSSCKRYGCTADFFIRSCVPAVWNHKKETENVIRVGKKVLGKNNIRSDNLPIYTSDDFAYFSKLVPGAFFFLSSAKGEPELLHSDHFDPDEKVLEIGSEMWYRLVEDRFEITFE